MKYLLSIAVTVLLSSSSASSQSGPGHTSTQTVKVIGHAHMDPVYRWRWNEIRDRELYQTFSDVLHMLNKHPQLHFAQSTLLYYSTIQQHFPDLFKDIKQSIADNRWSVVGGQWVETDETMPSGESLIRQFLISRDYYTKHLGIENISIAWSPDVFTGHAGTLPKIYAGCGIKNYVFSRAAPEGKKIFWWESKDGTRMLAYKIPDHYNPNFKEMPEYIKEWVAVSNYKSPMLTFGKGDHGGGPDEGEIEKLNTVAESSNLKFEHVSPENYFKTLNESGNHWPVQKTEFGYHQEGGRWMGTYSSQAKIKQLNNYYENQLLVAEKFSTIGTMHKGKPFYPREDFKEAWCLLLFNHFHDIYPGTLTGLGADDTHKDFNRLEQITSEQLNAGLENIGNRLNTEMEGIPLVVYNPHSWSVSQLVDAEVKFIIKPLEFSLRNPNGENVTYSIIEKSDDELWYKIRIAAEDVPAMGYKVFQVVEGKPELPKTDLVINSNQIENSHYVINWDGQGLSGIFSKKLQKEVLKDHANQLQLLEDNGNSWSLKLTGKEFPVNQLTPPKVILNTPLQVVIKWEDYFQSTKFTRYLTLNAYSDQIDFEMEVDWHSFNKLLRLTFPTNVSAGEAYFGQAYGHVKRTESTKEVPAQKWIDYSNSNYGISLINNGKYGFTIHDGILTMSVVRGARDMDPRMDEGIHSFKYSMIVHEGGWRDANTPQKAWELNQPLMAKQENHHPGEIIGWYLSEQSFPLEKSFFNIESDHVIITSLKTKQDAYNPNPLILRIVETEGRDEQVTVQLPYKAASVTECNHLEQPIDARSEIDLVENRFTFNMGHDQIRTFKIQF